MKLFKPYVNLTKSQTTGVYTLNAVIKLPLGYTSEPISQEEIVINEQKAWGVNLNIKLNGTPADGSKTEIGEFSIPLVEGAQTDRQKIRMRISLASSNTVEEGKTDVDFNDAEDTQE